VTRLIDKRFLVFLFILGTLLDFSTTTLNMYLGISTEGNPLLAGILQGSGTLGFLLFKISAVGLFVFILYKFYHTATVLCLWIVIIEVYLVSISNATFYLV